MAEIPNTQNSPDTDSSYYSSSDDEPQDDGIEPGSDSVPTAEVNSPEIEGLIKNCTQDPELCRKILDSYETTLDGWCRVLKIEPSSTNGDVRLSYSGVDQFTVLQNVVLWSGGRYLGSGQKCSRLCNQPLCAIASHVVPEVPILIEARENCLVYVKCPHCPKHLFTCSRDPPCIRYAEGYKDPDDFRKRGVCHTI